jgi:uncharacterized protein YaaR (DUF327 family)
MDKLDFSQGIEKALNTGNLNHTLLESTKTETRKTKEKTGPRDSGRASFPRGKGFSNALERSILDLGDLGPLATVAPSEEAMQELLDAVQSAGNDLKHRAFPDEILSYKKAVRNFLHYVIENSYKLEQTQTALGKKKDLKPYVHIRIIDQKLEELAAGILTRQISQLDLKTKLEEITGLLVDLTVTGRISQHK